MPLFEILVGKNINATLYQNGWLADPMLWMIAILFFSQERWWWGVSALLLSSFNPAQVLKGKFSKSLPENSCARTRVPSICMSIFLIAGTIAMYRQTDFIQIKILGLFASQILGIGRHRLVFDSTSRTTWRGSKSISQLAESE